MQRPLRGLYVVSDRTLIEARGLQLTEAVEQALSGGARIVQYRDKDSDSNRREHEASELLRLCKKSNAYLLINDDVALAKTIGAHGVHLGQGDAALAQARAQLSPAAIIGITCHADLALAQQAQQNGASYVAFGRFFPSQTKPEAPPAPIQVLSQAKAALSIPIVAIGGITPVNAPALLAAGADMLAVIHAIWGQDDIRQASAQFAELFRLPHET